MSTEPRYLGKYELRERLARGGMGEVWKAYDPRLRRYVAIKILHANLQTMPDFRVRFEREAQFIASLHHPNIVKIHDFQSEQMPGADAMTAYMVMDFVEGPTLAAFIRKTSRQGSYPSPDELVRLFTSISHALDYAHQQGMIHRDIKPANIILDQRITQGRTIGEPVLTDFGIAKLQGSASETVKGTLLGTPLYISPEQAQGRPGDERSDLYSLGIILYEMMTGTPPFRGDSDIGILIQHVHEAPTPPALINPAIPPALSAVILKSIAKDPNARYSSAGEMTIALAEALDRPVPATLRRQPQVGYSGNWAHSTDEAAAFTSEQAGAAMPVLPAPAQLGRPGLARDIVETPAHAGKGSILPPMGNVSQAEHVEPLTPDAIYPVVPQDRPAAPALAAPPVASPSPVRRKRVPRLPLIAAVVGTLVLVASGLSAYFLFAHPQSQTPAAIPAAGHITFLKSQDMLSGFDEVQITLFNVPLAGNGAGYYAWLDTKDDSIPPVHWPLTVTNGSISTVVRNPVLHQDLLTSNYYAFLVTREHTNDPVSPSSDAANRLYYVRIPQAASPSDHLRMIDHLHHLLADDPHLDKLHIAGGLDTQLLRNTQALTQQVTGANAAMGQKDAAALRQHLVNILYNLDGKDCAPSYLIGIPVGLSTAPDATVLNETQVSLLTCAQNTIVTGYVPHTGYHLSGLTETPGVSKGQVQLAHQLLSDLDVVNAQLQQAHNDAVALVKLPNDQLIRASSQLGDLSNAINAAYDGTSGQQGIRQISSAMMQLATFDVNQCGQASGVDVCA